MPKLIVLGLIAAFALYAIGGARAAETVIEKSADESVTASATLQADDELTFSTTSGVTYEVDYRILYSNAIGTGPPGLKLSVGEDANWRGYFSLLALNTAANAPAQTLVAASNASSVAAGTVTDVHVARFTGTYRAGGGTLALRWAQNVADNTPTVVKAGSTVRYRPIAEPPASGGGGGATAWADITDKPTFNADWLTDVDTSSAIDGAVLKYDDADSTWKVATDDAGGGSSGPVTLSAGDRERLDLAWWGVWALVGLALLALIAPAMYRLLDVRQGMGGRFERG